MADYISKEEMLKNLEADKANNAKHCEPLTIQIMDRFIRYIREFPAADVQPIVNTENMATVSDEFICKKCGIYIKDYIKVVMDEDNDGYIDEQHYEYEPKYCPNCGAKVKDGDTNG